MTPGDDIRDDTDPSIRDDTRMTVDGSAMWVGWQSDVISDCNRLIASLIDGRWVGWVHMGLGSHSAARPMAPLCRVCALLLPRGGESRASLEPVAVLAL